jgi:hypothetical protein
MLVFIGVSSHITLLWAPVVLCHFFALIGKAFPDSKFFAG